MLQGLTVLSYHGPQAMQSYWMKLPATRPFLTSALRYATSSLSDLLAYRFQSCAQYPIISWAGPELIDIEIYRIDGPCVGLKETAMRSMAATLHIHHQVYCMRRCTMEPRAHGMTWLPAAPSHTMCRHIRAQPTFRASSTMPSSPGCSQTPHTSTSRPAAYCPVSSPPPVMCTWAMWHVVSHQRPHQASHRLLSWLWECMA